MACDIQPKCCQQSVSWLLVLNTWPWFKKWAVTIKILTRFRKMLLFENAICYLQWALKTHTPIHFIVFRSTKPQPKKKKEEKKETPLTYIHWCTASNLVQVIWYHETSHILHCIAVPCIYPLTYKIPDQTVFTGSLDHWNCSARATGKK